MFFLVYVPVELLTQQLALGDQEISVDQLPPQIQEQVARKIEQLAERMQPPDGNEGIPEPEDATDENDDESSARDFLERCYKLD